MPTTPSADKMYGIANAEMGYHEGASNYNKYASYVGVPNYAAWCTTFVSWVFKTAGYQSLCLMSDYSVDQYDWYSARGRMSGYPAVGAVVWYGPGASEHTGWVYAYDADYIYTIEGNWGNQVTKMKRPRREPLDGLSIAAYGHPAFTEGLVTADPAHPIANSTFAATASVNSTGGSTGTPAASLYNPYPSGTLPVPNSTSPSAKGLQTLLIHAGYLASGTTLADNYGSLTQSAVNAMYTAHPDKFSPSITIGPLGLAQLVIDAQIADGYTPGGNDGTGTTGTPGVITPTSVLAAIATLGSTVVGGPYATDSGGTANININKTSNGVYWWKADMDIDTDGQYFPESGSDPNHQSDTSYHQSNGLPLNAGTLPFVVIPLVSSKWSYVNAGIKGGDSCIMIYNNKMVYGVFGDQGPSTIIGEASYAAAKALGVTGLPNSGIDAKDVTYIVFPGSTVSPIESISAGIAKGQTNAAALLAAAGVGTPPPPPPVDPPATPSHTVVTGDTIGAIATGLGVTVDRLVQINSLLPVGKVLFGETNTSNGTSGTSGTPDPYATTGLPVVGLTSPSAKALQTELIRVGYLAASTQLANTYGPLTEGAVLAFFAEHPFYANSADPGDAQIGPLGWAFLRTLPTGSGHVGTGSVTPAQISPRDVTFSRYSSGGTLSSWISAGCVAAGVTATTAWVNGYTTLCNRESAGDANAANLYDSNAINPAGYSSVADYGNKGVFGPAINGALEPFQCSRGVAQCIPQTFATYHAAGTSMSIYDPVANIAASIRYVRDVYGVAADGSNLASKVQQADPNRPPMGY